MDNPRNYIPLISKTNFFNLWNKTSTEDDEEVNEIYNYFKPFIETIPKLALGEYYWQIFNNNHPFPKIILANGAVDKLTPTTAQGLTESSAETFFSYYLPSDLEETLSFITIAFNKLFSLEPNIRKNLNITIYARIKNFEDKYTWNSIQYPTLYFDKNGNFKYGMVLYTNVQHLIKKDAVPLMTILDANEPESQIFSYYTSNQASSIQVAYPTTSNREKEIIAQLCNGKSSKQIAAILGITKNTVDNHRQRLLKKFNVKSTAELVIKAMIP